MVRLPRACSLSSGHVEMYSAMLAWRVLTLAEPSLGLEILGAMSTGRFIKLARRIISEREYYPVPAREAIDDSLGQLLGLLDERNEAVH